VGPLHYLDQPEVVPKGMWANAVEDKFVNLAD